MGSQVNFYMVPEDERAFCELVLSERSALILYRTRLDQPLVPAELPLPDANLPYCGHLVIWNHSITARDEVTPPRLPPRGDAPACYDINPYVYPVIEFWRSGSMSNGLGPGRIWATFEHECFDEARRKAFRVWFRRLAAWLNKLPYRWDMYRIGPETKEYFDAGGKAVGFSLGEVINIAPTGGGEAVVRRKAATHSFKPEIERDDGCEDLTINLRDDGLDDELGPPEA